MCMSVSYTSTCFPQPLYQILRLWSTNCFSVSTHHLGFFTNSLSFQTFPSDSTASCSAAHLLTQHPPWLTSCPLYRKPVTVWDTRNRSAAVPLQQLSLLIIIMQPFFYLYLEPCSLYLSLCSTSLPLPLPSASWCSISPQLHDVLSLLSFMMFYLWYLRWAMWWTVAVRSEVKLMVSTSVCCRNWWTSRQHKPHPLQLKLLPQQPLSCSSLCPILSNTRLVVVFSTHTSTWRLNCNNDMQCSSLTAFPLPDPSTLLAASQIQFDELHSELELLTKQLGVAKCHLSVVQDHSASHSRMQHFLSQSMSFYL